MDNAIYEGLQIMVLGMGTVFLFLIILVFVMGIVGKAVAAINEKFPEKVEEVASAPAVSAASTNDMIAVAIAAANLKKK